MRPRQTHEARTASHDVKMGSERGFGIVFAVVFALIGVWPAFSIWRPRFDPGMLRWWSLAIAIAFLAVALVYPAALRPLNKAWFLFGMLLSKVMTPIVMGLLFVLTVVPTGLIMRSEEARPAAPEARPEREIVLDHARASRPPRRHHAQPVLREPLRAASIKLSVVIMRYTLVDNAGSLGDLRTCYPYKPLENTDFFSISSRRPYRSHPSCDP